LILNGRAGIWFQLGRRGQWEGGGTLKVSICYVITDRARGLPFFLRPGLPPPCPTIMAYTCILCTAYSLSAPMYYQQLWPMDSTLITPLSPQNILIFCQKSTRGLKIESVDPTSSLSNHSRVKGPQSVKVWNSRWQMYRSF
jgi:hypothetical protein